MINPSDWQPRLSRCLRDSEGKDLGEVVTSWEHVLDDIIITLSEPDDRYTINGVSTNIYWKLVVDTEEAEIDVYDINVKFSSTSHVEAKKEAVKLITNLANSMMKLI